MNWTLSRRAVPVGTRWGRSCVFGAHPSWAMPPRPGTPPKTPPAPAAPSPPCVPPAPFPSGQEQPRGGDCGGRLCLAADAGSGDPTGPRAAAVPPTPHPAPRLALDPGACSRGWAGRCVCAPNPHPRAGAAKLPAVGARGGGNNSTGRPPPGWRLPAIW